MKLINQLAPCFGRFLVWVFFMGGGGALGGRGLEGVTRRMFFVFIQSSSKLLWLSYNCDMYSKIIRMRVYVNIFKHCQDVENVLGRWGYLIIIYFKRFTNLQDYMSGFLNTIRLHTILLCIKIKQIRVPSYPSFCSEALLSSSVTGDRL